MKKLVSVVLIVILMCCCALPAAANNNYSPKRRFIAVDSTGSYKLANGIAPNSSIEISEYENSDILYKSTQGGFFLAVTGNAFVPMRDITVSPSEMDSIETIISSNNVHPATAQILRKYAQLYQDGTLIGDGMTLFTMNTASSRGLIDQNYYTGYNGYQYRDDIVLLNNTSSAATTTVAEASSGWGQYLGQILFNVAKVLIVGVLDRVSHNAVSIASIFAVSGASSIPSNSSYRHEARLVESKWFKNTFMKVGSQYSLGCETQKHTYHFYNETITPGRNPVVGKDSPQVTYATNHYNSGADKKCYERLASGLDSYTEIIDSVQYGNVWFASV